MSWIKEALFLLLLASPLGPAAAQGFVCPVTAQPGTTQDRDQLIADGVASLLSFAVDQPPFVGWQWTSGSLLDPAIAAQTVAVTGICGEALIRAPGWDTDPGPAVVPDPQRLSKVQGAVVLLLVLTVEEIQAAEWEFRQGLAFSWGLRFLRSALSEGGVPPGTDPLVVEARIGEYLAAMTKGLVTGMAKAPGWYYDAGDPTAARGCFVTAPALISLAEAYNGGFAGDVYLPAMLAGLVYLQSAEVPGTGAYHYVGEHGWPPGGALEDAKSTPQGAAARTPSCELARHLWGDPATDLLGSLQDFYSYYDLLTTGFTPGSPCSHAGPFLIGCQYLLYGHYHVALTIERLPAGATKDAMRDCMVTMLGNLQDPGNYWIDTMGTRAPATAMAVLALSAPLISLDPPLTAIPAVTFRRGDTNHDGAVNVADPTLLFNYLFGSSGTHVLPLDAADSNDDGLVDVSDAVYLLNYLFAGGAPPPAPFPQLGTDPTPDGL